MLRVNGSVSLGAQGVERGALSPAVSKFRRGEEAAELCWLYEVGRYHSQVGAI